MKKYEFTGEIKKMHGITLQRIKAVRDFGNIKTGDLGGWLEKEENLSHEGDAMVCGNASVYGNARVCGNARVDGDAMVCGNARVDGDAMVCGNASVYGDAMVDSNRKYMCFQSFGSEDRTTTIFNTEKAHMVNCGCFEGTIDEFIEKVKQTHEDNVFAQEYLAIAEVAKIRIKEWDDGRVQAEETKKNTD